MERPRVSLRASVYIFVFFTVAFMTVTAWTLYYYRAYIFPSETATETLSEGEKYVLLGELSTETPVLDNAEKLKLLDSIENSGEMSEEEKINILKSLE